MENGPFEDVFSIENGDFPLLVYQRVTQCINLRLFQHTELEHTPEKPVPTGCKPGILS